MRPEDFPVIECVTHHYFDEVKGPGWRWYCVTCDTGTQVRKHGRHLHKLEGDAAVGAKYHRNQKRKFRQERRWQTWWYQEILKPMPVEEFERLWRHYFRSGFGEQMTVEERTRVMLEVQADPWLVNGATRWAKEDQELYGHLKEKV